jgi:hypothetical protein
LKGLVSQANVLARIGSLGGFYGVDLSAMQSALGALGPALAHHAMVTIPATFDRVEVTTRVARDRLDALCNLDQLRRLGKLVPDARELDLEIDSAGTMTVRALGTRHVAADSELLANFGVGTLALDTLRDCAAHLGPPFAIADREQLTGRDWLFGFAQRNASDSDRATARMQLLTVARKLGATAPQCNLVDGLHDSLAKDRDSYAVLAISPEQTTLQLAVRWQNVRWETVIRMMLGFHPKSDAGKKLGELAGAADAEHAAAIELTLGPTEPPAMRVAVTLTLTGAGAAPASAR